MIVKQPSFSGLIGVAREDITPPIGICARNWGAARHERAEGIHRPLTVTALTLQRAADDSPLVLLAVDLGWWRTRADEGYVRGGLIDSLSLDPARVMINLAHTHAGPSICREDAGQPGGDLIPPYLEAVKDAVIRATRRALEKQQPSVLAWSYGKCTLAQNRNLRDPEGERYLSGYHPGAAADDTLLVGRVTGEGGDVRATLVNYACHPVTLAGENRLISPDYVGAMREIVEAGTGGAPCLFLQGASGELAPREQYSADVTLADQNGRQLGYAALSTLEGMLPPGNGLRYEGVIESGAPLAIWNRVAVEPSRELDAVMTDVDLLLKPMPTLEEFDAQIRECGDPVLRERLARKRRIRRDVGEGATAPMPLWTWRAGDAIIVGHPNEAYSALQTELRRRFPEHAVIVMNVVNGHYGYLPPAPLYDHDIYPVWQTPFERGGLEHVVQISLDEAERLVNMSF